MDDSYDEEVAEQHELENKLESVSKPSSTGISKNKTFQSKTMIRGLNEKNQPNRSRSDKFTFTRLSMLEIVNSLDGSQDFETNLKEFDLDQQSSKKHKKKQSSKWRKEDKDKDPRKMKQRRKLTQ